MVPWNWYPVFSITLELMHARLDICSEKTLQFVGGGNIEDKKEEGLRRFMKQRCNLSMMNVRAECLFCQQHPGLAA